MNGGAGMVVVVGDVLPEIALVLGGVVVLLYALSAPADRQVGAAVLALTTVAIAGLLTLRMLDDKQIVTFFGTYARDGGALWAKLIVLGATAATIGLSVPWFRRDPRHGEYYTLLLYSALGAVLLAGATDLKEFIVAMLLSSATGFVLCAYHRRSSPAAEAAIKYYLIGALANSALLIGVAFLFGLAGGTTLEALATGLPGNSLTAVVGVGLVILGITFKIGAVPAHAWMPDVAQGAPAPVAAFVTAVPKVGGFLFLARFVLALPAGSVGWEVTVALLAAATMTLGNLACLWQDDLRRLLGWSAVSQTGYGLMAIVAIGTQRPRRARAPLLPARVRAGEPRGVRGRRRAARPHCDHRLRRPCAVTTGAGRRPGAEFPVVHRRAPPLGVRRQAAPVPGRHRGRVHVARRRRRDQHGDLDLLLRAGPGPRLLRGPARADAGARAGSGLDGAGLRRRAGRDRDRRRTVHGRVQGGGTAHPLTRQGARGRAGLASMADVAHARGVPVIVDNTFAPVLAEPIKHAPTSSSTGLFRSPVDVPVMRFEHLEPPKDDVDGQAEIADLDVALRLLSGCEDPSRD